MKRNMLNLLIDALTALAGLGLLWTGLLIYFILPAGSGKHGLAVWGMGRHDWGDIHFWLAVTCLALVVLHVALHWTWVCTMVLRIVGDPGKSSASKRNIAGLLACIILVGLIGGSLWYANSIVETSQTLIEEHEREEGGGKGRGRGKNPAQLESDAPTAASATAPENDEHADLPEGFPHLRGSMTIAEVAEALGVQSYNVIDALGLPGDISPTWPLGPAARHAGLTMNDVRKKLSEIRK